MQCKFCNQNIKNNNMRGYCQSCYKYLFIQKKDIYATPAYGEMTFAPNGDCICPKCGMAYRKLGSHLWNKHRIKAKDAYKAFGWDMSCHASNEEYQDTMKSLVQPHCIYYNLLERGEKTRFKKGGSGRTKDKVSAMTLKKLQKNFKKGGNKYE